MVGAGPGIGRACAVAFARAGANVVVAARRETPLAALATEVRELTGSEVAPVVADLSDPDSCVALVTVATAGGGTTPIDDTDWNFWRRAFEVNVIGTMEVSRVAARSMPCAVAVPEEIAEAALLLCCDRSKAITGVEIPVTAGQPPL